MALKADILKLRDTTQSKIFFLMVPPNAATWKSMKNNFKDIGTVIDIKNTNTTIPQVIEALKKSTICNTQLATSTGTTTTPATTKNTTATVTTAPRTSPPLQLLDQERTARMAIAARMARTEIMARTERMERMEIMALM